MRARVESEIQVRLMRTNKRENKRANRDESQHARLY